MLNLISSTDYIELWKETEKPLAVDVEQMYSLAKYNKYSMFIHKVYSAFTSEIKSKVEQFSVWISYA